MTERPAGKLRVAVLMGGLSTEHDVSISSGLEVLAALDRTRYDVVPVTIERDGAWLVGHVPERRSLRTARGAPAALPPAGHGETPAGAPAETSLSARSPTGVDLLRGASAVDIAFIALHGPFGEDGTVQGLLRMAGIPFTGSGVLASALAMDKAKAKEIYAFHGLPIARHAVVRRRDLSSGDRVEQCAAIVAAVGMPCVVKPVAGGSSVGASIVRRREELDGALDAALAVDDTALVEEFLAGTEVTCGVLGGGPHEPAEALPVTEIVPADSAFFDFRAKYTAEACAEITPARLPDAVARQVQELAVRAHEALGCEGMSRSDFIIRDGAPVILETNTIPGMTDRSLLPQAAAHAGLPFPRLLDRLIESGLRRARGSRVP